MTKAKSRLFDDKDDAGFLDEPTSNMDGSSATGVEHKRDVDPLLATQIVDGRDPATKDPAMWAITYQQLMELDHLAQRRFKKKYARVTMRDINRVIIEPRCAECSTSYALHLNPEGLAVDAFVTHAWDEPFAAFIESIQHVFHTTMHKPTLWICATALIQGDIESIEKQIGVSLEDSPFVRALSKASMYVVVRNSQVDVYSRIWCVAELLHSKKLGLIPDNAFVTGPDSFSGVNTSCLDAQAFDPKDRDRILRILLNEHDREEIDDFVHQFRTFKAPRQMHGLLGQKVQAILAATMCLTVISVVALGAALGKANSQDQVTPTDLPSYRPSTATPTDLPSYRPSTQPSILPSQLQSSAPCISFWNSSGAPSTLPPASHPTLSPTSWPTKAPTSQRPTKSPTRAPTFSPTCAICRQLKLVGIQVDEGDGNGGDAEYQLWATPTGSEQLSFGYWESQPHSWNSDVAESPILRNIGYSSIFLELTEYDGGGIFDPDDKYSMTVDAGNWYSTSCATETKDFCLQENENVGCTGFQVRFEISPDSC